MPTVVHFDISANDTDRAKVFYQKLFNWQIEKLPGPMNYYMVKTNDLQENQGVRGGISEREAGRNNGIINYIGVSSIDAVLKLVIDLGGKVVQPGHIIPGYGQIALCADTEDNIFGIFEEVGKTRAKHDIKEINWPEKAFLIKRATLSFDKLSDFLKDNYAGMYSSLSPAGIGSKEMPCAIYYSVDEIKKETDCAAAIPVLSNMPQIPGFEKFIFPASRLVTTTHIGPYETMATTYAALEGYIDAKHHKRGLIIEEYCSDPEIEKDPTNWKTNIYFQLK